MDISRLRETSIFNGRRIVNATAGLYVPLRRGASPISLDLGATYRNAGRAAYLREGDIEDLPDGGIAIRPRHSDTDLLSFHLGVAVGISR